jgi:ActR/RegA family two-component response regulator
MERAPQKLQREQPEKGKLSAFTVSERGKRKNDVLSVEAVEWETITETAHGINFTVSSGVWRGEIKLG